MNSFFRHSLIAGAVLASINARADIKLPAIISDHMVVQAEAAVPIWGWGAPGEQVSLSLAGQTQSAKTGNDGRWQASFNLLKANGQPQTLTVTGSNSLTVNDVLIGEVWLASGQSNMAFTVQRAQNYEQEKAAAQHPLLRMFTVTAGAVPRPQSDCGGKWEVCTPESLEGFSAVAYFFGRELQQTLKTPVGLVHSSVGGTDIAAWTSMEAQQKVPELNAFLSRWKAQDEAYDAAKAQTEYKQKTIEWKAATAQARAAGKTLPRKPPGPLQPRMNANYPAHLFESRLAPLIPYGIKGAIWYQGEHNSATPAEGLRYRLQLPLLINDWRSRWGSDFPFAWVQLPGFATSGSGRAYVREAMLQNLSMKDTGMVVTLDVGEADNNHPRNKQAVGRRLALWALGDVYHLPGTITSGPLPAGQEIRDHEIVLSFTHTEQGLVAHGELKGFVIAGEDQKWQPATARIEGDKVIVGNAGVAHPKAVRYAWAASPECSLFNGAGLPASPFRTDEWTESAPVKP
ncbi:MAG: hypothetical protein JWO94_2282 [Verrucomicrobiaceae bacterium]|nr:hypothetical protein [Verrucomicrobiaceae bacterium]